MLPAGHTRSGNPKAPFGRDLNLSLHLAMNFEVQEALPGGMTLGVVEKNSSRAQGEKKTCRDTQNIRDASWYFLT